MSNIIISSTPYRISFAGGMSDIPEYYNKYDGYVISTTINKYIYIVVHKWDEDKFKLSYSNSEEVDSVDDIKHPIIRECLKYMCITEPMEISSFGSVKGSSGLGSSSAFTVGLLNALYKYLKKPVNRYTLAEDACKIEIDTLGEPIGKQDQYIASYGGFNGITFTKDKVFMNPISINTDTLSLLNNNLMMFSTGIRRKSGNILSKIDITKSSDYIGLIKSIAYDMSTDLTNNKTKTFGKHLFNAWECKSKISGISNTEIDDMYNKSLNNGALGGKILGAGGGGYLLLYCEEKFQDKVRLALCDYNELKFKFEDYGSKIIYEE